ncbi:protein kinase STUNTED-like isoform X1 [Primulina huaijiensis]|uniref:protein kinase STUNTED-like isoform X1 n=1 Tax=Primulina huaijiensis TaxID=1492673 RepID=UPI003CC78F39
MRLAGTPCSGESCGGGTVVVVGVKLDLRSRELLTWALVKVAQAGDRVIALHVLDPSTADKTSLISLVKNFDSVLAAYEGFCNLKQVDLKLKVCRGSPVRKILSREAKSCGATSLIVGTSEVRHTIRSRISVAKYCAKNLQNNILVVCADNGKIVFQSESAAAKVLEFSSCDISESRSKRRRTTPQSPLNLPPTRVLSSSSSKNAGSSLALLPIKTHRILESTSGWALLRKIRLHRQKIPEAASRKSSILQWMFLKLPGRQSVAAIYPDQKQITSSCKNDCSLEMDQEEEDAIDVSDDTYSVAYSSKIFSQLKGLGEKYDSTCQSFSFQELLQATNNFARENLIGKGGSSEVYRGCLRGGKELAVKILKPSDDVLEQFFAEINIITSLHHKNIISLVGFCLEDDRLLLVYDLLSRGSLEDNLHGTQKFGKSFGWKERYKVALGVAEALDHLHNTAEPIIHRDVKSSNILLSDDFDPQLADFGLATWASCSHHIGASDVTGTFGYLAPEYFMHGKLDEKIDVYAFGVVLLELLSGRKPIDNGHPTGQESLVMWARHILKNGDISELRDPDLASNYDNDQVEKFVSAATLCIRDSPQSRPEISLILKLLRGSPEVIEWAHNEIDSSEDENGILGGPSPTSIQSFLNLALLNLENESDSISSSEQNISVEDYLGGRWSLSTSFD